MLKNIAYILVLSLLTVKVSAQGTFKVDSLKAQYFPGDKCKFRLTNLSADTISYYVGLGLLLQNEWRWAVIDISNPGAHEAVLINVAPGKSQTHTIDFKKVLTATNRRQISCRLSVGYFKGTNSISQDKEMEWYSQPFVISL